MKSVILIDDHELAHAGMRLLLRAQDRYELTACFGNAANALDHLAGAAVDLVILDLELPGTAGAAVLPDIVGRLGLPVIVLTGVMQQAVLQSCLGMGASAIVSKGDPVDETLRALEAVERGEPYLSTSIARLLEEQGSAEGPVAMSGRQREVLQLLAGGLSNKEISYRLGIAQPTVSFHIAEMRRKLGARHARQLVELGRAAGLV